VEERLSLGFGESSRDREKLVALVPLLGELRFYRRFLDEVSEFEDWALAKVGE
jgi:hypothetical protein